MSYQKFRIWNLFVICFLFIGIYSSVYALNLDKLKSDFLDGDYKAAITEGEKIMAFSGKSAGIDELYYYLALSYMKEGKYLRAGDIFEIILSEFKNSPFFVEAKLGAADNLFLSGDRLKAGQMYEDLLKNKDAAKFRPIISARLSECGQPSFEYSAAENDLAYTVQVGSFSNISNAKKLVNELKNKGFDAYLQENQLNAETLYKVRVGNLGSKEEALSLENKLKESGYPTKIFP